MLKHGFEMVWTTVVEEENFDIRYFSRVENVNRNESSVLLQYAKPDYKVYAEECDFLIWTAPMTMLLNSLSNPTKDEIDLFSTLSPHYVVATLMKEKGVIRNMPVNFYQESLDKKIDGGVAIDYNLEDALNYCDNGCAFPSNDYSKDIDKERHLTFLQFTREAMSEKQANQIAREHYEKGFNATSVNFLNTKIWTWNYQWTPKEVAKGNHWKVFNIQGKQRTWYAGSSVSFEMVKSVMEYNELLLRQMN